MDKLLTSLEECQVPNEKKDKELVKVVDLKGPSMKKGQKVNDLEVV